MRATGAKVCVNMLIIYAHITCCFPPRTLVAQLQDVIAKLTLPRHPHVLSMPDTAPNQETSDSLNVPDLPQPLVQGDYPVFGIGVKKTGSSTQTNNATMGKSLGSDFLPTRMAFQSQIRKSRPSCLLQSRHGTNFTASGSTPNHGPRRHQRPHPNSHTL